jgi:undecaprenyl-diphosphatase
MIDVLYQIDVAILYFLNQTIANPVFDKFFVFITDVKNWYLTYIVLFLICFFKGGRIGKLACGFMILLIITSDQISSHFLKNLFERVRPCNVLPDLRTLLGCSGTLSFPSSHAVNNFAAAAFFAKIFPKYKWVLFISAFCVAISRPYLGLHYPSDTLGGAIIGFVIGYIFALIVIKVDSLFNKKNTKLTDRFEKIEFK